MRFSTRLPGLVRYPPNLQRWEAQMRPADLRRVVHATEEAGLDAVTIPEQIVLSTSDAEVMGGRWPDAMTTMAYLCGLTDRLHFISSILILPLHEPIGLAKQIATLDVLTEGRVEFGLGVSNFPAEYEALGVPFNERGRIADEYLEAMFELWRSDSPSYQGHYVSFSDVVFEPKPRPGGPTIWVGGDSSAALRRAARFANGWMPWRTSVDALPARREELLAVIDQVRPGFVPQITIPLALMRVSASHEPIEGSGRPDTPLEPHEVLARTDEAQAAGATMVSVPNPEVGSLHEHLAWLERFGAHVIATRRARTD